VQEQLLGFPPMFSLSIPADFVRFPQFHIPAKWNGVDSAKAISFLRHARIGKASGKGNKQILEQIWVKFINYCCPHTYPQLLINNVLLLVRN